MPLCGSKMEVNFTSSRLAISLSCAVLISDPPLGATLQLNPSYATVLSRGTFQAALSLGTAAPMPASRVVAAVNQLREQKEAEVSETVFTL